MSVPVWLERAFLHGVDQLMGWQEQPVPSRAQLESVRLIAHRGAHAPYLQVRENTIKAFERAAVAGVHGIEFDVRWTRDGVPVVFHDQNCKRVFGRPSMIHLLSFKELRQLHAEIPSLDEVIEIFAGRLHLMIEIKDCPNGSADQLRIKDLSERLHHLKAGHDFHLMSLSKNKFSEFTTSGLFPAETWLSIAQLNSQAMSRLAANHRCGGFTGHYLFVSAAHIAHHHQLGQVIGTGFADSRNVLFREINRGVDWIFSNRAVEMKELITSLLETHRNEGFDASGTGELL